MKKEFADIQELLQHRLVKDADPAQELMNRLKHIKSKGYFTKPEFLEMCNWKSPRPRRHFESNSPTKVIEVSKEVFATEYEKRRIDLLTSLKGVNIPTASAILTLTDPQAYGVIDIRVWKLLYLYKSVTDNPAGTDFSFRHWFHYLKKLRYWAERLDVSARAVERTLFEYHKEIQEGTLYSNQ